MKWLGWPPAAPVSHMNLPSSQLNVRWKAVWGSKRKFGGACSPSSSFTGFTANAIADGRHGRSGHKAGPGCGTPASGYRLDEELAAFGRSTQTTRVIVTLQPGARLPDEFKRFARRSLGIINGSVVDVPTASSGSCRRIRRCSVFTTTGRSRTSTTARH
jgi:hypothetical protein